VDVSRFDRRFILVRMSGFRILSLARALAFFLLCVPAIPAQTIPALPETPSGDNADHKEPARNLAGQLVWAGEQAEAARKQLQYFESEPFSLRLAAANAPEEMQKAFVASASEEVQLFGTMVEVLEAIQKSESQLAVPPDVAVPTTPEEALALRERLALLDDRLGNWNASFRLNKKISESAASSRAEAKAARDRIRGLVRKGESDDLSQLQLEYAELRYEAASALEFLTRWQTYRPELEQLLNHQEIDAIKSALQKSAYGNPFAKPVVQLRQEQLTTLNAELQKKLERTKAVEADIQREFPGVTSKDPPADQNGPASENETKDMEAHLSAVRQTAKSYARSIQGRLVINGIAGSVWNEAGLLQPDASVETLKKVRNEATQQRELLQEIDSEIERALLDATQQLKTNEELPSSSASQRALREKAVSLSSDRLELIQDFRLQFIFLKWTLNEMIDLSDAYIARSDWSERAGNSFQAFFIHLQKIWYFSLVDSPNFTLTIGKLVWILVGLVAALVISKFLAGQLGSRLRRHRRLAEGRASMMEKWVFYLLVAFFVLSVLQWLEIPLTVFAFLGGALAIGIGFGGQNLMNNFISGLILQMERRVRVGDIVETSGFIGSVVELGSRCSRIRKFDGVEVMVPNSILLEQNVTNWTLSDKMHRFEFVVGVAYGSPLEKVLEVLNSALREQPEILKDPPALVFFENFGDSTLDFRLYYWLRLGDCDGRQVGSELRMRIERLLSGQGIEIAFPQRDLHLRSSAPVRVKIEKEG
jgi:potassium-dependent mechanosensitive channel